jgi:hypothetical protein
MWALRWQRISWWAVSSGTLIPHPAAFLARRLTKLPGCSGATDVECGGKRSATPLWLRAALLLHQRITAVRKSGVALRLPPHSIATLSMAVAFLGGSTGPCLEIRARLLQIKRRELMLAPCKIFEPPPILFGAAGAPESKWSIHRGSRT